jgi:hypothetical protein
VPVGTSASTRTGTSAVAVRSAVGPAPKVQRIRRPRASDRQSSGKYGPSAVKPDGSLTITVKGEVVRSGPPLASKVCTTVLPPGGADAGSSRATFRSESEGAAASPVADITAAPAASMIVGRSCRGAGRPKI